MRAFESAHLVDGRAERCGSNHPTLGAVHSRCTVSSRCARMLETAVDPDQLLADREQHCEERRDLRLQLPGQRELLRWSTECVACRCGPRFGWSHQAATRGIGFGCGNGTDSLTLAMWGIKRVDGIDLDHEKLAVAEHRLAALRGWYGQDNPLLRAVTFHQGSASRLHKCFGDASFDVVVDTLLWNNVSLHATPAYVRQAARVLKPSGTLILQVRQDLRPFDTACAVCELPDSFHRYFNMRDGLPTHLPEFRNRSRRHAGIVAYLGRRRHRPLRA